MAKAPVSEEILKDKFGPHLNYQPPGGWSDESVHPAEKLVKTHCCFCGQQCGIQLKVRDNRVIGFEPWEEFPFNRGMLCPKGVKRYLQGNHPDRLLAPLMRSKQGFRPASWDEALNFTVSRMREIQEKYGKDAFAIYGGASLSTEKSYLLGKFARVALGTRHIDYNGRLCMVSAGTAYKLAFGIDRSTIPWSEIPKAEVLFVIGANIGECAPNFAPASPTGGRACWSRSTARSPGSGPRRGSASPPSARSGRAASGRRHRPIPPGAGRAPRRSKPR